MMLRNQSGWTLMETLVVTSMITIIAAAAVPQYAALAQQMRTSAAATQLLDDLNFARMMAVRTGRPHYVRSVESAGVHYRVQRAAAPPAIAPNDPIVREVDLQTSLAGVVFSLNGAAADPYGGIVAAPVPGAPLVFDPRGLPTTTATYFVASADGGAGYAVTVTGAGHARVWKQSGEDWK